MTRMEGWICGEKGDGEATLLIRPLGSGGADTTGLCSFCVFVKANPGSCFYSKRGVAGVQVQRRDTAAQ